MKELIRGWRRSTGEERAHMSVSYAIAAAGTIAVNAGVNMVELNSVRAGVLLVWGLGALGASVGWLRVTTEAVVERERQTIR